jgi:RNA polymerase sigma-70 factor (ECF subfamily)
MPDTQHDHSSDNADVVKQMVDYAPFLRNFARRFDHNPAAVDDLVQETIVKALSAIHLFRRDTNLKAWLACIMRNIYRTKFVRDRREPNLGIEDVDAFGSTGPEQEWMVLAGEVSNFIDAMEEGRRDALVMVAAGVSYEETAAALGCEMGTVKSRVNRARTALSERFGAFEHASHHGGIH